MYTKRFSARDPSACMPNYCFDPTSHYDYRYEHCVCSQPDYVIINDTCSPCPALNIYNAEV